ncbi:MAG TPA: hypothetical protein VMN37_05640 [Gemmatimonadales bacterium]|nr:hypothetical protein [Gemmatimonadales bacterium]
MRLTAAALLAMAGCRTPPVEAPVPVEGSELDLAALAGTWSGSYHADGGSGHETIVFDLVAGADTARGQVEMTFAPALALYGEGAEKHELARRPCTAIDIAVVRVEGRTVRGTLAPYWNPACDCRMVSVFEGELAGDAMAGTFSTRHESGGAPLSTGRWRVDRSPT